MPREGRDSRWEPLPRKADNAPCACVEPLVDFVVGAGTVGVAGGCERPNLLIFVCCGRCVSIACNSTKRSVCSACAARYKRQVREVCRRGIVDAPSLGGTLTLTAPGVGVHCRKHRWCNADGLGCEACPCSVESLDIAEWNATLGERWNRFLQAVRRGEASAKVRGVRQEQRVEYFKGVEVQDRGALHLHVPMVSGDDAPVVLSLRKLRALAIAHGFGHSLVWDPMTGGKAESAKLAGYVSKYVAKASDERASVPWRSPGKNPDRGRRFRTWTASREWRCRMLDVRGGARRSRACAERRDGRGRAKHELAGGEPLDLFETSYTVDRAPPRSESVQLVLW